MKSFSAFVAFALPLFATINALPAADALPEGFEPITRAEIFKRLDSSAANTLEKRTPGGIFICTGENYSGTCGYKVQPFNQCIVLDSPYYHNIGSFGPDRGALCRLTTSAPTCTTHGDAFIQYPGTGNLRNYNGVNVGDYITSFLCQECTNCQ